MLGGRWGVDDRRNWGRKSHTAPWGSFSKTLREIVPPPLRLPSHFDWILLNREGELGMSRSGRGRLRGEWRESKQLFVDDIDTRRYSSPSPTGARIFV